MRSRARGRRLLVTAALALLSSAAAQPSAWYPRLRAAAVAHARRPLAGDALSAARVEVARARAAGLPQLRLRERSRLALDASFALTLEAGVSVPLWAPAVAADRRLTAERLSATRRQLAAERRAELHDALAGAVSLLAAEARLAALDALHAALEAAGDPPALAPPTTLADVRLLAANRSAQRRRADALRQGLQEAVGVRVPPAGATAAGPGARPTGGGRAPEAARAARDPLGFTVAELEPERCVAASDRLARAREAAADARLAAALAGARAETTADLDLGLSTTLGSGLPEPTYGLRLGVAVRLPPWSAATGAAALAVGAAGLEQSLSARWPNRAPAARPAGIDGAGGAAPARADADVLDAASAVRRDLDLLRGQEADLTARRRILLGALAEPPGAGLEGAYRAARLALQLADADEALGITRLDAALLCGALPP